MCNIALVTFLWLQYWSAWLIKICEHRKNVHFLCLEPRETDKNVLKLSWNLLKIWSWNFTSCSWEPWFLLLAVPSVSLCFRLTVAFCHLLMSFLHYCHRSRHFGTKTVRHQSEMTMRQFGTKKIGAEVSGHFGTSCLVPKCLGAKVSWCRSVLTPFWTGMLTILVKTIVNTNNNTLAKSIADTSTNTNTVVTILFTVFTFSNVHFSMVIY